MASYWHCRRIHDHLKDSYCTLNVVDPSPEYDEFEDGEVQELSLRKEGWQLLARELPGRPLTQEPLDVLGQRDIDINYNCDPHVGRYTDEGILQGIYWKQLQADNPQNFDIEDIPWEACDTLNPEQRIVYDTVMGHFMQCIQTPLLLHVDGGSGTGKSFLINMLSSHLQQASQSSSPI